MKCRFSFMMSCDDFQLRTGAEPGRLDWRQHAHRLFCRACRRFAKDVQRLERQLACAFEVDVDKMHANPPWTDTAANTSEHDGFTNRGNEPSPIDRK